VELTPINLRDPGEIERAISAFARSSNGGLIVTAAPIATAHRDLIITLAARHKLCAVYNLRFFVTAGGLISYGTDVYDLYRRAAGYIDRVLKGEKPSDRCQYKDRQSAGHHNAGLLAYPRWRFDRINMMSAIGTKRTSQCAQLMSAFGGKADITRTT
jgi:hypothetical protein